MSKENNAAATATATATANLSIEELRAMLAKAEKKAEKKANAGFVETYNRLKKNRKTAKGSIRDTVALAYIVARGGSISNADIFTADTVTRLFKACGEPLADKDGQYRQGLPQLLNCATALGVNVTITVEEVKAEQAEQAEQAE